MRELLDRDRPAGADIAPVIDRAQRTAPDQRASLVLFGDQACVHWSLYSTVHNHRAITIEKGPLGAVVSNWLNRCANSCRADHGRALRWRAYLIGSGAVLLYPMQAPYGTATAQYLSEQGVCDRL